MQTFRSRLEAHVEILLTAEASLVRYDVNPPVDGSALAEIEERLGFALDPRFVDYFRSTNGWDLRWVQRKGLTREQAAEYAAKNPKFLHYFTVPSLETLFAPERDAFIPAGTAGSTEPLLGGYDEEWLRRNLRVLALHDDTGYESILLLADSRHPDPVVIRARDHAAALSDCRPVRARFFFEERLFMMGNRPSTLLFFEDKGAAGDHPMVDLDPTIFPPFPIDGPGPDISAFVDRFLPYLRGEAGLAGKRKLDSPPVMRYSRRFKGKPRSKLPAVEEVIDALGIFDTKEHEGDTLTFFLARTGPAYFENTAELRLAPPYGKATPDAEFTFGDALSDDVRARVEAGLVKFGMTPE